MTESFHWDKHFVTGLADVDSQHHHLVDLINAFGDKLLSGHIEPADLQSLIGELKDYSVYHFTEEEALMDDYRLAPEFIDNHKGVHRSFIEQISLMGSNLDGENGETSRNLLNFLWNWLAFHILGQDQVMARQMKLIDEGMGPAAAFETVRHEIDDRTEPLLTALTGLFSLLSGRNLELEALNRQLESRVADRTQELKNANQALEQLSSTDMLTELPNRRRAMQYLALCWDDAGTTAKPLACMMIDADHFKEVNDSFGHKAGDTVLRQLALVLAHGIRTDDFVARLGGDEFFIICPNTSLSGALLLAEDIRAAVQGMNVTFGTGGRWDSSISIGVAVRSRDVNSPEDLLKLADDSLYQAKAAGRNRVGSVQTPGN